MTMTMANTAKRTLGWALIACALLLTVWVAYRAQLDHRARHFARAFVATTRSDVPVTLPEQILYSMFYSASQPDSSYGRR